MRRHEIDADYAADAPLLRQAWRKLDLGLWLSPVARHLRPAPGSRVLDVGAGAGQLAAWFQERGYRVTAVEPVSALWDIEGLAPVSDYLPRLSRVSGSFALITCVGVLHHLPPGGQRAALSRMAALLHPGGKLVIGARHGPGPRPLWPIRAHELVHPSLCQVAKTRKMSIQPANRSAHVRWTWIVSQKRELQRPDAEYRAAP